MARSKRGRRGRVGKVSFYPHHGGWWLYYRENGKPVRRKVAGSAEDAEKLAAQINADLATAAPTLLAFEPVEVAELCKRFFEFHESVLKSSLGTIRRYKAALRQLESFARSVPAHQVAAVRAVLVWMMLHRSFRPNGCRSGSNNFRAWSSLSRKRSASS